VKTYLDDSALSLAEAIGYMEHVSIYEAEASGPIHDYLKKFPGYHCSEYFDNVPLGLLNESGTRCESLERLTYADNSFDLVITQDVLEHVNNPEKAFLEVYRVLKPNGYHVFTVPFHEGKKTVTRVKVKRGRKIFLLSPVYHGDPLRQEGALVYTDFGEDILDYLKLLGLPTEIVIWERFYSSDMIPYITDRSSYKQYLKFKEPAEMLKYFLYNSVVFKSRKERQEYSLREDGERFLPWMKDPTINYEHLHRYGFAGEFVEGKKVLDLACGEGYGSAMLADKAEEVVGIDINEVVIEHACTKYAKDNLRFVKSSLTDVAVEKNKQFDVIICFEALEHIAKQNKAIAEVKRLLRDNGIFIVSMPNKYVYSDQSNYKNPWHKKELYFDEFKNLLKGSFNHVVFYGQKVFPASNIFPILGFVGNTQELAIEKRESGFSFVSLDKKHATYFIAVASNKPMRAPISSSYLVDTSEIPLMENTSVETIRSKLEAIHHSHGWKFLVCYYKFRDRIFPPDTKRRVFAKSLLRMVTRIIRAGKTGFLLVI
jgi:2-polyprenyl-3-methyl-5-hydroxy-6-metoxy-1,4-benzoquinol methylase